MKKGCVIFRSTFIVHPIFTWYSDDGPLSKKLCSDEDEENEHVPLDECNACDEAKYELAFEGIFSRNTHPKDFPEDGKHQVFIV
jgi:spondin-1